MKGAIRKGRKRKGEWGKEHKKGKQKIQGKRGNILEEHDRQNSKINYIEKLKGMKEAAIRKGRKR